MATDMFIVLAAYRSGTTLLLSYLNSHHNIRCHKRLFTLTPVVKHFLRVDRRGSPFHRFRTASIKRRIDYIFSHKQVMNEFMVDLCASPDRARADIAGVRITYAQADKHPDILEWAAEKNVAIIHLVRENALQTIVSSATARKRGIAHSTSHVKPVTVWMPPFKLRIKLTRLTHRIDTYRSILIRNRHLEVTYEDLATRHETEINRVLDFLNIAQCQRPLTSKLVKLNSHSLEEIIENYEDIKGALSDTPFERFLATSGDSPFKGQAYQPYWNL